MSKEGRAEIDAVGNEPAHQVGSGAWARAASDEELQYQIDGGFPNNSAYEATF